MTKPIVIDLFSGCGGFGLGAELAGFHSKVAVDIDPDLQSAYKLNFPSTNAVLGNLLEMRSDSWKFLLGGQSVDGVIGGPPCQGFSRIGKNDKSDPRRTLLFHFFRTVNIIQPKFFIMENVEGLLDEGNLSGLQIAIDSLDKAYQVLEPIVVDASNYGAPTKRKRVVVVGFNSSVMNPITHEDIVCVKPIITVKQAISDVPHTVKMIKGENEFGWVSYFRGSMSNYAREMRKFPPKGMGSLLARKMHRNKLVSGAFETIHSKVVKSRFSKTQQGIIEPISRYPRLDWRGLCPTLRAGTGSDRGSFQAARPIHPSEPRVITVREAARLQGFPDWFLFHTTKHHSFRMIGNSVSPMLSREIMGRIKVKLALNFYSRKVAN